ncbi:transcriptional activator, TenA family [Chytriomyces cf. hyalinus JEL632]|nr:transcriptional activator, TenA family [Chytriomyces cf. hyalinus JEL632]
MTIEDQRFTAKLRQESEPNWTNAVQHRFVHELLNGSIHQDVLRRYLIQDHRFLDSFLALLGAAMAHADTFDARITLGKFVGLVAGGENTYFERAFQELGVDSERRSSDPDSAPTAGFKAIMIEASKSGSYAAILSVLSVAEWLYMDWASIAPKEMSESLSFVNREWFELHRGAWFEGVVAFLRSELDRVGPANEEICRDYFSRAVGLELEFFNDAYTCIDKK